MRTGIYLLNINNRNSRTRCEICSKLRTSRRSGIFIVDFEHAVSGWVAVTGAMLLIFIMIIIIYFMLTLAIFR